MSNRQNMQSDEISELATALAKAQGAMQNAVMNRTNPHFRSKYADLSSVLDAIRAPLSAAGLSIVQTMQHSEDCMVLRTTLLHSSGQYIATEYPLPNTQKPHEMGSALTYARRYSISALVCNSSDEDDDGNHAMGGKSNGNGTARINADQVSSLRELAYKKEADIPKLCSYFKVAKLEEITPDIFPNVVAALNAKRDRELDA